MIKNKNILIGIGIFVTAIIFLLFLAFPLQVNLGLLGLGLTQIGLLIIAIVGGIVLKNNWKETFPIKKPNFKEFRGSLYIYIGIYFFTIAVANIMMYLFPGMAEVNDALMDFFSEGGILLIITVSIMPGICEEALFRGAIRSAFGDIKKTAVIVCIVGVLFGLFHLDVYRFLITMILGMGLTYIMVKTGNILYPIFFHLIHNLISILPVLLGGASVADSAEEGLSGLMLVGIVILFFAISLQFLWLGIRRLNNIHRESIKLSRRIIFEIACFLLALTGLILAGLSAIQGNV